MVFEKKTETEIVEDIELNLIQNINELVDVNEGSVIDIYTNAFAVELEDNYTQAGNVQDSLQIDSASGDDLDQIGKAQGIIRNEGTTSNAVVSFIRNEPAGIDFTIPSNIVVSTRPINDEEQLSFTTADATTFPVSNQVVKRYIEGIYEYTTDNILFTNTVITGASPSDYEKQATYSNIIIDTSDITIISECELAAEWVEEDFAAPIVVNSSDSVRGSNSLSLIKSSTGGNIMSYTRLLGASEDLSLKSVFSSLKIKDQTTLDKINNIKIIFGTDSDVRSYEFTLANLTIAEFKRFTLDLNNLNFKLNSNPDITAIDFFKIKVETNNNSDVFVDGDVLMDFWLAAPYQAYNGSIIKFLNKNTADNTDITLDYDVLSVEVDCISQVVGSKNNVLIGSIIFVSSPINNIDRIYNYSTGVNGLDIEIDLDYRDRIVNSAAIRGSNNADSIVAKVISLPYVKDAKLTDTPVTSTVGELHVYNDTTKKFSLINKVPIDDANLLISGYTRNTDFILNSDFEIEFDQGGTDPANNDILTVDYNYNRIGFFDIVVSSEFGSFTTEQLAEIEETLDNAISVGIQYNFSQPTFVPVAIELTIEVDTNYLQSDIETALEEIIQTQISLLNIGDTLRIADLTTTTILVPGILNVSGVTIDALASDKVVTDSQQIVFNTLVIN